MSRRKNRSRLIRYKWGRDFLMLNINIRPKLILMKLLKRKFIVYKDILKPKINRDVNWLA